MKRNESLHDKIKRKIAEAESQRLASKFGKAKDILAEMPQACHWKNGPNEFAFSYAFPKVMLDAQIKKICDKAMLFAFDKDETEKNPAYRAKFFWFDGDNAEEEGIVKGTLEMFGIEESEQKDYKVCARFFERLPDGKIKQMNILPEKKELD